MALVGNPNTGKSTLFNALTGFRRHVANYPGVTVDVGRGPLRGARRPIELLDLPGTYSLAAASPDEMILCDALRGQIADTPRPSVILALVDASNPMRNLYLVSQLLEVGLPLVVALNMVDVARARGIRVDAAELGRRLGVPVFEVVATEPRTVAPLVAALEAAVDAPPSPVRAPLPPALLAEAGRLAAAAHAPICPSEALRVLVDQNGHAEARYQQCGGDSAALHASRERLRAAGLVPGMAEIQARYAWIDQLLAGVVERTLRPGNTWSDRLDRVLTHRIGGALALLAVLYVLFYAIYSGAEPLMAAVDGVFGWLGTLVTRVVPEGMVESLLVDGVLAGVGGVIVFLPQILILFLFIAVLEDCGYMSRAAFMVDRLMRPLGLSGRAFIPLLSAFACAVPAIMGTRAIADRRERFITILIAPFMSCSARLPVYVLLIGAFVPRVALLGGWVRLDALVMLAMYLVGVVVAIPVAYLLRKTAFAGPPSSFLLELPGYKLPRLRSIAQRVYFAGRSFLLRAGTIILAVNVLVWALAYFPRDPAVPAAVQARQAVEQWESSRYDAELAGAYLRDSYLGRAGHALEPVLRPLGWDWRIGVGVIASFPAREVIIATLGTMLNLSEADEHSTSLADALRGMRHEQTGAPVFTLPVALSVMVFFALCAQCASTLVMIGRETNSWLWPVASFVGMTVLAYLGALAVVQVASVFGA